MCNFTSYVKKTGASLKLRKSDFGPIASNLGELQENLIGPPERRSPRNGRINEWIKWNIHLTSCCFSSGVSKLCRVSVAVNEFACLSISKLSIGNCKPGPTEVICKQNFA